MISDQSPGTQIETSAISHDFYEDFRQLVADVNELKKHKQTLQNRVDQQDQLISQLTNHIHQQNETIAGLTTRIENEKKKNEEVQNLQRATTNSTNQFVHLFNDIKMFVNWFYHFHIAISTQRNVCVYSCSYFADKQERLSLFIRNDHNLLQSATFHSSICVDS
ncbi:hypothetical protein BLNAU_1627 [Blattamonas nauphoetae]|uniref:t-SNARE coiled-coil homology domain-containing protein n=1 Tax=Blattamonas nauphoetae TaxID=2049346 RepID=A0ABQ9YIK0_9EUKA|nr:hypothetical protein BLNAU_1627 [Blattamonas nauphoetae]